MAEFDTYSYNALLHPCNHNNWGTSQTLHFELAPVTIVFIHCQNESFLWWVYKRSTLPGGLYGASIRVPLSGVYPSTLRFFYKPESISILSVLSRVYVI